MQSSASNHGGLTVNTSCSKQLETEQNIWNNCFQTSNKKQFRIAMLEKKENKWGKPNSSLSFVSEGTICTIGHEGDSQEALWSHWVKETRVQEFSQAKVNGDSRVSSLYFSEFLRLVCGGTDICVGCGTGNWDWGVREGYLFMFTLS